MRAHKPRNQGGHQGGGAEAGRARETVRARRSLGPLLLVAAGVLGCAGDDRQTARQQGGALVADAFAKPVRPVAGTEAGSPLGQQATPQGAAATVRADGSPAPGAVAAGGAGQVATEPRPDPRTDPSAWPRDVVAIVGSTEPAAAAGPASAVGRDVLADAMVGQINGRPVFASEVLDPLEGQLRALSKDVKPGPSAQKWVRDVTNVIGRRITERVRDELILAEARAQLSPEQKQGLIFFLQRLDQFASGRQGGSRVQAEEAIREATGQDYDQFLQAERDKILIRDFVGANVSPGVRVPWKKVERFYNENQDVINPPPKAQVRFVMIEAANAAAVERARAAAGDAEAFAAMAAEPLNVFDRSTAGLKVAPLDRPYAQIEWVGNRAWNQAAAALEPGQSAGPITTGDYAVFIRREPDISAQRRSLEDVQLEVSAALTRAKEEQEQNEFFQQLLGKSSFTPVGRMTLELLLLAAQRHLSPELAAMVRDANPVSSAGSMGLERSGTPIADTPVTPTDPSVNPPAPGGTPGAPGRDPR